MTPMSLYLNLAPSQTFIFIYIYSATLIYCTYIYTGSRTNGNGYFRLCVADGNGKRKFLFLGRQTIYGNPQSNSANVLIYALRLFMCYKSIFPISIRGDIRARTLTFHGLYRGKACNRELFSFKAGFSTVESAEKHAFPQDLFSNGSGLF